MERADWLGEGLKSGDARLLMLTAITHHRFSSAILGEREVRKLHAELAEFALVASRLSRSTARPGGPRSAGRASGHRGRRARRGSGGAPHQTPGGTVS